MPTYEYRCRDCAHEFEIVQAFSDDALTECPECKGSLGKVFGNVGITFKGSGFYKTDNRASGNGSSSSSSRSSSDKSSSDSSSGSSESSGSSGDTKSTASSSTSASSDSN